MGQIFSVMLQRCVQCKVELVSDTLKWSTADKRSQTTSKGRRAVSTGKNMRPDNVLDAKQILRISYNPGEFRRGISPWKNS